ncbi:MAG TPA: helix-turn-helix domain-containing protein [Edaphobacter sp.]|nr:helix-turn-helix domain-containing protein [Edaphobacter sp.]
MPAATASRVTREEQEAFSNALQGKQFLSDLEVEARLGVPRKTLQNWRVLGRGPRFRKFGSGVRYSVADLDAWIESLPSGGAGVPSSAVQTAVGGR